MVQLNLLLATIISFALLACLPAAVNAASTPSEKFVTIPIYYLTDRHIDGATFGGKRRYPFACQHQMYYGTTFVTVANKENKTIGEKLDHLNWKFTDRKGAKIAPEDRITPDDPKQAKTQFFGRLKKALDSTGSDNLCIFVHGADDRFDDAAQDAALLAYAIERPMVLYSWPSDPKLLGYVVDNGNSEWSQAHFDMFCKDLLAFKAEHPLAVTLIAHSMGNRLPIRALPVLYGTGLVTDWELISPDIDAETCKHYVMSYKEKHAEIHLYVSAKDKMLPLSQKLFGGYYRLGEDFAPHSADSTSNERVPASNAKASAGDKAEPGQLTPLKPEQEMLERIDFTTVDTGLRGHSIPFELVANMIKSNEPGTGLKLEAIHYVGRRDPSKSTDDQSESAKDSGAIESVIFKKVVRVR